jgi:hypothetical protein
VADGTPDWATLQAVARQRERGSFSIAVGNGIKAPRISLWVTAFDDRLRVKLTGFVGSRERFTPEEIQQCVSDLGTYLKELAELTTAQPQTETETPHETRTKSDKLCWTMNFVLLGSLTRNTEFARALRRIPADWRESLDG